MQLLSRGSPRLRVKKLDLKAQEIAKSQHGAISWQQLQRLGFNRFQVERRVRSGEWVRELPGVWRLSWAEPTWTHRVWCAWLWGGTEAVISHRAAARLWELDGVRSDAVELTTPKRLRTRRRWVYVHQSPALPRVERHTKNGVALTSPSRTLVDLAGAVDEPALQRALEHALRRKIASISSVWRALRSVPSQGRPGTGTLRTLLDSGLWRPELQSELERSVLELFRHAGLPEPECQYTVVERGRRLGDVDFAWPHARVIVEAEGFQFHSGRQAWERDIARYNRFALHGWTVLRVTQGDLEDGGEEFANAVRRALERGGRAAAG